MSAGIKDGQMSGPPVPGELLLYRSPGGDAQVQVLYEGEIVRDCNLTLGWMPQNAIAELSGVGKAAISKHLKNIFETGELAHAATVSILETVRFEGSREVTRQLEHYNLDAVLAVG